MVMPWAQKQLRRIDSSGTQSYIAVDATPALYQFVWLPSFERTAAAWLDDAARRELENDIAADPERMPVVPATGGVRKIRVALPERGRGKRGGARAIYYYRATGGRIYMIAFYLKAEKADLTATDKAVIKRLVEFLDEEAAND